jgi:hypothetical protein
MMQVHRSFAPFDWRRGMVYGGGGGGYQTQTFQQSKNSTDVGPPAPIADALNSDEIDLSNWYNAHPNAPAWFPKGTVVDYSPQTAQSINDLYSRGYGSPFKTASQGLAMDTLGGKYLDLTTNPYLQGSISYAQQPVITAFNNQILPSITGTFEGAGRTPQTGNLAGNAVQNATDTLTRNLAGAATQAGLSNYTQERGNQMNAIGMLPSFQAADYQDLMSRLQAGGMLDQKAQQKLEAENQKYAYEQTAQPDWITQRAQRRQIIYPGSHTTGSSSSWGTQYTPGSGGDLGSFLGAGLGLGSLALKALPLFGISDRRDKTDIKKLGTDPLTGLPMAAYRYKGDPKTYPKVVGPMAQDIEARGGPVRQIGGHKVVPMRMLRPAGGLM